MIDAQAFADELEKIAGLGSAITKFRKFLRLGGTESPKMIGMAVAKKAPGVLGLEGIPEAASRALHPIEGTRAGWQELPPRFDVAHMPEAERAKALKGIAGLTGFAKFKHQLMGTPAHVLEHPEKVPLSEIWKKKFTGGAASKLEQELASKGQIPMMMEELGRRGWTGTGKITKYLPVGNKGMMAAIPAMATPGIVSAPKPTPTSEGGSLERGLRELGGGLGFVMGGKLGLVPGFGLMMGGAAGGERVGRILDRLRGGAKLRQAISAPSPEEAMNQMRTIQQYYGG